MHGEERLYPTASVYVQGLGQTYLLEVGVVDIFTPSDDLGWDFPLLFYLVPGSTEW